jgi:excisionase family DNA binding protein
LFQLADRGWVVDAALVNAVEDVDPPATTQQRQGEQALAEAFARGEVVITARRADGTELPLDTEDLRGLLAVISARALGHRVSIVVHEMLISPQTAATLLDVSRPMVYRYIERGDLAAVRVGSHWRMRAGDVLALVRRRAEQAQAIDAGVAAALEAGGQAGRHLDAKQAWRQASTAERKESRDLVADILDPRRSS